MAQNGPEVSIDAPAEVRVDSDFVASVNITEVSNFDACQFDLTYDADVLEVGDVTAGEIGGTAIPIDAWGFVPTGEQGKIRVLGNVPGVPGVDGSGYLAQIHFQVIGEPGDTSTIGFSNGLVGDKFGNPIDVVTWRACSLIVTDPTLDEFGFLPLVLSH
jgi:hypothetical protein